MNSFEYLYSPKAISSYVISELEDCEASLTLTLDEPIPTWNLFWLSTPTVDRLPGSGSNWWRLYVPNEKTLCAVVYDAANCSDLHEHLLVHPTRFIEWFRFEDHTRFRSWEVLGGDDWVSTVILRAAEAAKRMAQEVPAIFRSQGNIHRAVLGRAGAE